jgi:carbamoyltransferase
MKEKKIFYIGMNKSPDRASVCTLGKSAEDIEIYLKERFSRLKSDGGVDLSQMTKIFSKNLNFKKIVLAENSYYKKPADEETRLESEFPYHKKLTHFKQQFFTKKFNKNIIFLTHHYCHARAAAAISPFKKSIIVVMDCSGNASSDFPANHLELKHFPPPRSKRSIVTEACTVYLQNDQKLNCVRKEWQTFRDFKVHNQRSIRVSDGLGRLYEAASQYIFNSIHESGKVMGLAAFGQAKSIDNSRSNYIKSLNWKLAFTGKGKSAWQRHGNFQHFANIAATVQDHFEKSVFSLMKELQNDFPEYENLIFTGGTALNCVTNSKLLDSKIFSDIYIPPFPGDESISFGAAAHLKYKIAKQNWVPVSQSKQRANFGPKREKKNKQSMFDLFLGYRIVEPKSIYFSTAKILAEGKLVGWYQGQSESGPRALGNRSLLADPRIKNLKEKLNESIKKREMFRPYGCSCLFENVSKYFRVKKDFESPFMSFAPTIRPQYQKILSQVSHIDGTSRVQTVRPLQNARFYQLLLEFEKRTGIGCLLNTSLNVMGEPIVETVEDAKYFFDEVAVDALVIGDYLILRG